MPTSLTRSAVYLEAVAHPASRKLPALSGRWGDAQQSQVMQWRLRVPAKATMLNASMAHALDFDDALDHGGSIHPGAFGSRRKPCRI
jgi:2-methylcitrate dehydratase PrpD